MIKIGILGDIGSGKTFVAMASGILHKKILYICPAKPVAFQVGQAAIYKNL